MQEDQFSIARRTVCELHDNDLLSLNSFIIGACLHNSYHDQGDNCLHILRQCRYYHEDVDNCIDYDDNKVFDLDNIVRAMRRDFIQMTDTTIYSSGQINYNLINQWQTNILLSFEDREWVVGEHNIDSKNVYTGNLELYLKYKTTPIFYSDGLVVKVCDFIKGENPYSIIRGVSTSDIISCIEKRILKFSPYASFQLECNDRCNIVHALQRFQKFEVSKEVGQFIIGDKILRYTLNTEYTSLIPYKKIYIYAMLSENFTASIVKIIITICGLDYFTAADDNFTKKLKAQRELICTTELEHIKALLTLQENLNRIKKMTADM
jgi:hypothetical protein